MKNILVTLLIIITFSMQNNANAQFRSVGNGGSGGSGGGGSTANNQIARLGPFAVGYEFCQKIQAIAPILSAYSTVQWPVIGAPGLTFGLVQNESALLKICDFLVQLQSLNTEGAIFHSARFLNELTGNKWDNHLAQADLTWNVANSLYDFRGNGGFRQGALTSAHTHRRLVDFADRTAKYYQTEWGDPNRDGPAEGIESKQERKQKLDRIAKLSYQRAILSEASSCPSPQVKTNYQDKYLKEVVPEQENIKIKERNVQFYFRTLLRMGTDFITDLNEMQDYKNKLEALIDNGYAYRASSGSTSVKREVPTGKMIKDPAIANGLKPEVKTETKRREYQRVRVIPNSQLWNQFRQQYVKRWETYIKSQLLASGTFGLLDGKKGRIEAKYRSYAMECSEQWLAPRLPVTDRKDPRYWPELQKMTKQCKDNLVVRDSQYKNLMDRYVRQMDIDLRSAKVSQAKIWTFESLYFGVMPIQSESARASQNAKAQESSIKSIQAPQKSCRADFTPAEMDKIGMELQNVENALTEEIVKQQAERSVIEEQKEEANKLGMEKIEQQNEKEMTKGSSKVKPSSPPLSLKPGGI